MKPSRKIAQSRAKPTTTDLPPSTAKEKYVVRLFVAGATARSQEAVVRVRALCGDTLKGRVNLEVIDIYQQPGLASENQIVATPTLIIQLPLPVRRFIGNLTNLSDLFCQVDMGGTGRIVL